MLRVSFKLNPFFFVVVVVVLLLQNGHRDDGSLDGGMSDDIKMIHTNGSVSSRGSSPAMDNDEMPQAGRSCIVQTLGIVS